MLPEHEHLLRANISYFHAYGHQWRDEKAEHAREIAEGYRNESAERERFSEERYNDNRRF